MVLSIGSSLNGCYTEKKEFDMLDKGEYYDSGDSSHKEREGNWPFYPKRQMFAPICNFFKEILVKIEILLIN